MMVLFFQIALLVLLAYLLGCFLGDRLARLTAGRDSKVVAPVEHGFVPVQATEVGKSLPAAAEFTPVASSALDIEPFRPQSLSSPRDGKADNLKRIRGIGQVNENRLNELGIYHYDQIASWTEAETRWVGDYLDFPGRVEREDWVGQAKILASGSDTAFSMRVDKGNVPSSQ